MSDDTPDITSRADLEASESQIAAEVRALPLDGLLLALRAARRSDSRIDRGVPPHVIGVAARFATRLGKPGPMTDSALPVPRTVMNPLLRKIMAFAHADPCAWLGSPTDGTLPIMLRHAGNQFPYHVNVPGKWGRAAIMFDELPGVISKQKNVPAFDFASRFEELTGVTVREFLDVGFVTYAAAASGAQLGFARDYFEKARQVGMTIADDDVVRRVLASFAADTAVHARKSEEYKQKVRDFAAYDFNSLFVYPLIRPWPLAEGEEMNLDRMIAPIPELIPYRMTSGIYYDMHFEYKNVFDEFFGHLLSAYVGHILKGFVPTPDLLSEGDIRESFSTSAGKVPDWIIVEGKTAVLIEVKVARIHRLVYAMGDVERLDESLDAVRRALGQMHEFTLAVRGRAPGLERLFRVKDFINIVVTLEQTYLANSTEFKARVRSLLPPRMQSMEWAMLSLDEIEWFQAHLVESGINIASAFRLSLQSRPEEVINDLAKKSGRTFGHSMLARKEGELYRRIGVPVIRDG